jgi:hypothetical protein
MSTIKIKESEALKEVKEIRQQLYEQTKDLPSEAFYDWVQQQAEEVSRKYNLKVKRLERQ